MKQKSKNHFYRMLFILLLILGNTSVNAETVKTVSDVGTSPSKIDRNVQQQTFLKGVVTDANGVPIAGANIIEVGTTNGVTTDFDGNFNLKITTINPKIKVTYIGFKDKTISVKGKKEITVALEEDTEQLDEVVLVSFGKQKKKSMVSSITTVKPADLKIPSSDLTTSFAGNLPGMIAYQRIGEPGLNSNVEFFIRGVTSLNYANSPLILIDGVELTATDLSRLQPDDVASFSIMKDASATALYGARGANGVIYITTKEGKEGKLNINIRFEESLSSAIKNLELADPLTYMKLHNEAIRTRDPLGILPYSLEKVDNTIAGNNPTLYPVTDWYKELFSDYTINKRLNFSLMGGGSKVNYYVSGSASQDRGILKVPKISSFTNNIDFRTFQLRSNIGIQLTESTKLKLNFTANFDDYTGPLYGGSDTYQKVMMANPVLFKPFYDVKNFPDHPYTTHILFGNYDQGNYINPYADMVKGYKEQERTKFISQVELNQNFDFLLEGLQGKAVININRTSGNSIERSYNPFFYSVRQNRETGKMYLTSLNETSGTEGLSYREFDKYVTSSTYLEGSLTYTNTFNEDYDVSAMLVGTLNHRTVSNAGSLQASLPYRNAGVSGRLTFTYADKYLSEFNFGYNGSERFHEKERFGFFPSAGLGWVISNESFFEKAKDIINNLKIKTTFGLVGNDKIGSSYDRFFYLSQVNLSDGDRGFITGTDFQKYLPGVSVSRYANNQITWETSEKFDIGIELGLFNKIKLEADYFTEHRSNILTDRIISSETGIEVPVKANFGEVDSHGVDGSITYTDNFTSGWWIQARANFTYATNKIVKLEEPDYSKTPWLSRVGHSVNQMWGLVAERLFVDQAEINNSPKQTFGEYMGGDIKYKDINGDGRITNLDRVPMGNPTKPEIVYGFGVSTGYKGFDFSCFFQGLANESFWINTLRTAPFVNISNDGYIGNNQLLKAWAESHWSEDNRDVYAKWPRLSDKPVINNLQGSNWFMQDGSFLRLKSAEFGYSLPNSLVVDKWKMNKVRFYLSGTNLLTFSKFKLWDPEMAGDGLKYPTQRVFNLGIHLMF